MYTYECGNAQVTCIFMINAPEVVVVKFDKAFEQVILCL